MKIKSIIVFLFFCFNVKSQFQLNKIGITIKKPDGFFLLTTESINELKKEIYGLVNVCDESKISLKNAITNPNYQVLLNSKNYNEIICFIKFPKFNPNKEAPALLQKKVKENCYSIKNSTIEYLETSEGLSKIGNYTSVLNKITTPTIKYYSEAYFIETRNSTILITINSLAKKSNIDFLNNISYLYSLEFEEVLTEVKELFQKDEVAKAKEKILKAIENEPKNIKAYEMLSVLNFKLMDYQEVINNANEILKIDETNINGYILKGRVLYNQKQYSETIINLENAKVNYAVLVLTNMQNDYFLSFGEIYRIIGESYMNLKNADKSIENLEAGLRLSIDSLNSATIYYNLGIVYSTLNSDPKTAIKYYSLAIPMYPAKELFLKSEAYFNSGVNKRSINDLKGAIIDYSKAIKIRPNYTKAIHNRGFAKQLLKDYYGAITDFTLAIKYDNYKTTISNMALYNRGLSKTMIGIDGCTDFKKAMDFGDKDAAKIYSEYCK